MINETLPAAVAALAAAEAAAAAAAAAAAVAEAAARGRVKSVRWRDPSGNRRGEKT